MPKTSKVERLINLVICLLSTRQFVTAEYVHRNVAGYNDDGQSDEAFNRMFERDKNELRDLGIPLVTGPSAMGQGADGYRINRDSYALPDLNFDRDEAAAISMAAALWDTPEISAISQTAVLKLRAAGFEVRAEDEVGVSAGGSARSLGSEATLGALVAAIQSGRAVRFSYRAGSGGSEQRRELEPWGVVTHRGRWYVVGHDRARADTRTFRLSRVADVVATGPGAAVTVPDHTDLQGIVAAAVDSASGADGRTARIRVPVDRGAGLRRLADSVEPDGAPADDHTHDIVNIEIRSLSTLARMVLGAGADAEVLGPPELRDTVVAALDELLAVDA